MSLLFLGQGVKNSAQTTNHASLLPNKKTKVKPILETDGEFELANDVSPSHSAHAAGVKKGSKTIFHATPASLSNDVKYADFSNSHTDNDELITAAAYEPLDSNGALSSDVSFKHQIIENHIDSSKGDAGSSSGLHKNSLENQNLALSEKSLITNNGENTNLELARSK